jgi:hypothetical protein
MSSWRLKNEFVEVDESFFEIVKRVYELVFSILYIEKSDLYEVAEVLFYLEEWFWKLIICLPVVLENDVKVHEATVQGMGKPYEVNIATWASKKTTSWSRLNDVLSRRVAKSNHNRPSVHLKIRLWCQWRNVTWCRRMALRTYNLPSGRHKKRRWSRWRDVSMCRRP